MFSLDAIEFETMMNRHLFDGQQTNASTASSSSSTDFYLCQDNSSDDDLYSYSGFNSDQENTDCDKL